MFEILKEAGENAHNGGELVGNDINICRLSTSCGGGHQAGLAAWVICRNVVGIAGVFRRRRNGTDSF